VTAFKPGLTVRAIRPVIAGLEALGHSVDSLLAEAGMPASILADLDGYLPAGSSRKLWERAVAIANDDCGIHVAMAAPVNAFDVHAYAMLSSPTLSGALYRVCRYQRLINEGTELTLEDDGGDGVLRHGLLGGGAVSRQPAEFLAVTWLRLGRMVTGWCRRSPKRRFRGLSAIRWDSPSVRRSTLLRPSCGFAAIADDPSSV